MDILSFVTVDDVRGRGRGWGYGWGDGDGDGAGRGWGDGDGWGCGDGRGEGLGDGRGDGDGWGYGWGDGDGRGNGWGDGDGIKTINGQQVYRIDGTQTILTAIHGNVAKGLVLRPDLQLSSCYVCKGNNLFAHGATLREAQKSLEDKIFENLDTDTKIAEFKQQFTSSKKYPVKDFYDWHHKLTGSCEFGRNQFAKDHGIDLKHDKMTVSEFVKLTKTSYGGEIISRLEDTK